MPNIKPIDNGEPSQAMALVRSTSAPAANSTDKSVQLQPGSARRVQFLIVVAHRHGTDLLYKINSLIAIYEKNTCPMLEKTGAYCIATGRDA